MPVMVMVKATKNSEAGMLPGDPGAPAGFDKLVTPEWRAMAEQMRAEIQRRARGE